MLRSLGGLLMGKASRGRAIRVHFIYLKLRFLCFHGNFGYKSVFMLIRIKEDFDSRGFC